ncbi:hypothetical protein AJ79_09863 [Helicocarpus griseus UAMH5409]|uniref:Protein kinase domain-containing protein n=1 Tax=Helicocarpus griseus UAMH5409 TaxID=1447875 RepID=A0A2B7W8E8_9EURO|nr:hypothetical protein AJ79_09863 [Helicocarpus griseus UAMH5409]
MDLQRATSSKPKQTCWTMWLKHREERCPFIQDLSSITPSIEFLELLFTGDHSYLFKVQLQAKMYPLKLLRPLLTMTSSTLFHNLTGHVHESKLVGVVGPYCHGWLVIDKALERDLEQLKLWKSLEEDPIHGLLLEYVEGCTIDKGSITAIAAQSLRDQLDHLHNMDIAHGDLCPRNIMVSSDGRAFLLDFSSAKLWPHSSSTIRGKDDFLAYNQGEKRVLELILFRLQKSEEEAYGQPTRDWENGNYAVFE